MEKITNDVVNFSNLPTEIQQHVAAYLDAPALGFFALSHKQALKNILPQIVKHQATFPLRLTAKGNTTYLTQANPLFGCGGNGSGQLGLGDTANRLTFTAVPWPAEKGCIRQIIAGEYHTVVLTDDHRLWGCGANGYGQLGLGDKVDRLIFTAMPWPENRGRIRQVIAGRYHTIVLTDANRLWVCGRNTFGQLGLGDTAHRLTFTAVPWPAERGQIRQVIVGVEFTFVLTDDHRLWGCGYHGLGQLGLGDIEESFVTNFTAIPWSARRGRIEQVITGENHTVVLTDDHRLWVCGYNGYDQLGLGNNEHRSTFAVVPWPGERGRIHQVIAGGNHTLVLTETNQLWGCGANYDGQLGLGDYENRKTFTAVPWPEEHGQIRQIIAGDDYTVVLTQVNRLWGCGNNEHGQLGLGANKARATFTPVKVLPEALQQLLTLNNTLNQLITLGQSLTPTPGKASGILPSQHQPDEPEGQPPKKKMRL